MSYKSGDLFISTLGDCGIVINTDANTDDHPKLLQNSNRVVKKLLSLLKLMNKIKIEEFYDLLCKKLLFDGSRDGIENMDDNRVKSVQQLLVPLQSASTSNMADNTMYEVVANKASVLSLILQLPIAPLQRNILKILLGHTIPRLLNFGSAGGQRSNGTDTVLKNAISDRGRDLVMSDYPHGNMVMTILQLMNSYEVLLYSPSMLVGECLEVIARTDCPHWLQLEILSFLPALIAADEVVAVHSGVSSGGGLKEDISSTFEAVIGGVFECAPSLLDGVPHPGSYSVDVYVGRLVTIMQSQPSLTAAILECCSCICSSVTNGNIYGRTFGRINAGSGSHSDFGTVTAFEKLIRIAMDSLVFNLRSHDAVLSNTELQGILNVPAVVQFLLDSISSNNCDMVFWILRRRVHELLCWSAEYLHMLERMEGLNGVQSNPVGRTGEGGGQVTKQHLHKLQQQLYNTISRSMVTSFHLFGIYYRYMIQVHAEEVLSKVSESGGSLSEINEAARAKQCLTVFDCWVCFAVYAAATPHASSTATSSSASFCVAVTTGGGNVTKTWKDEIKALIGKMYVAGVNTCDADAVVENRIIEYDSFLLPSTLCPNSHCGGLELRSEGERATGMAKLSKNIVELSISALVGALSADHSLLSQLVSMAQSFVSVCSPTMNVNGQKRNMSFMTNKALSQLHTLESFGAALYCQMYFYCVSGSSRQDIVMSLVSHVATSSSYGYVGSGTGPGVGGGNSVGENGVNKLGCLSALSSGGLHLISSIPAAGTATSGAREVDIALSLLELFSECEFSQFLASVVPGTNSINSHNVYAPTPVSLKDFESVLKCLLDELQVLSRPQLQRYYNILFQCAYCNFRSYNPHYTNSEKETLLRALLPDDVAIFLRKYLSHPTNTNLHEIAIVGYLSCIKIVNAVECLSRVYVDEGQEQISDHPCAAELINMLYEHICGCYLNADANSVVRANARASEPRQDYDFRMKILPTRIRHSAHSSLAQYLAELSDTKLVFSELISMMVLNQLRLNSPRVSTECGLSLSDMLVKYAEDVVYKWIGDGEERAAAGSIASPYNKASITSNDAIGTEVLYDLNGAQSGVYLKLSSVADSAVSEKCKVSHKGVVTESSDESSDDGASDSDEEEADGVIKATSVELGVFRVLQYRLAYLCHSLELLAAGNLATFGNLDQIESLLGAPLELYGANDLDCVENFPLCTRYAVCCCLYGAVEWIRCILNCFATAACTCASNVDSKSELLLRIVQRFAHLLKIQDQLVSHIQRFPEFLGFLCPGTSTSVNESTAPCTSLLSLPEIEGALLDVVTPLSPYVVGVLGFAYTLNCNGNGMECVTQQLANSTVSLEFSAAILLLKQADAVLQSLLLLEKQRNQNQHRIESGIQQQCNSLRMRRSRACGDFSPGPSGVHLWEWSGVSLSTWPRSMVSSRVFRQIRLLILMFGTHIRCILNPSSVNSGDDSQTQGMAPTQGQGDDMELSESVGGVSVCVSILRKLLASRQLKEELCDSWKNDERIGNGKSAVEANGECSAGAQFGQWGQTQRKPLSAPLLLTLLNELSSATIIDSPTTDCLYDYSIQTFTSSIHLLLSMVPKPKLHTQNSDVESDSDDDSNAAFGEISVVIRLEMLRVSVEIICIMEMLLDNLKQLLDICRIGSTGCLASGSDPSSDVTALERVMGKYSVIIHKQCESLLQIDWLQIEAGAGSGATTRHMYTSASISCLLKASIKWQAQAALYTHAAGDANSANDSEDMIVLKSTLTQVDYYVNTVLVSIIVQPDKVEYEADDGNGDGEREGALVKSSLLSTLSPGTLILFYVPLFNVLIESWEKLVYLTKNYRSPENTVARTDAGACTAEDADDDVASVAPRTQSPHVHDTIDLLVGINKLLEIIVRNVYTLITFSKLNKLLERKKNLLICTLREGKKFIVSFILGMGTIFGCLLGEHPDESSNEEAHMRRRGEAIESINILQKATRYLQTVCAHGKVNRDATLSKEAPAIKRALEQLIFKMKHLVNSSNKTQKKRGNDVANIYVGNLKHRRLDGTVISKDEEEAEDRPDETESDGEVSASESDQDIVGAEENMVEAECAEMEIDIDTEKEGEAVSDSTVPALPSESEEELEFTDGAILQSNCGKIKREQIMADYYSQSNDECESSDGDY